MKILVPYDGTVHSRKAIRYGLNKAHAQGGELTVLAAFHASLFIDYDAGPQAVDRARSEFSLSIDEAKKLVETEGSGVPVRFMTADGDPEELAIGAIQSEGIDLVLAPPRFRGLMRSASVPVQAIPGTILVPADNTGGSLVNVDEVVREANQTGSRVVLAGIIPVHLYSRWERKELDDLKRRTEKAVKALAKELAAAGLRVDRELRAGYPDEEILKAADAHEASLIMLPAGSTTPSELSKAAVILLDEPSRLKRPILLTSPAGAA